MRLPRSLGGTGRTTQAVAQRGRRALVIGLAWGHDLGEARQRAHLFAPTKRVKPRYVWQAFPCTAFCCWVRLNRSQGCDLAGRQREGKRHLRTTLQAAQLQRSLGGQVALENPLTSLAWRDPAVAAELSQPPWLAVRLDQCAVGLTGPAGGLHLKPTAIRTTCSAMAQALNLRCSGDHSHETVEGKATGLSAMYSPQLARRIANVVVPTKIPGGGVKIPSSRHAGASSQGISETAAEDYLELILTNEWQEGGLEKALLQGNSHLEAAGGVPEAVLVFRAVGRVRLGDHCAELGDPHLDEALDADLLAYARTVADRAVRACYEGDRSARVTAEPHASAREHLPEAMSQLWKDARRGRVILCDDRAGGLLSGVLSMPLARVPKINPDRTVSDEGRTVWDQRVLNEGTDPAAHPPALQPRH